jgi:tetratricopeptide (TPR) repeat protein
MKGSPPPAWILEAWWMIEEGNFADAQAKIDQALVENPTDPDALNCKGFLLARQMSRKAKGYFQRALDSNPKNNSLRASILCNLGRSKEALQVIDAYLSENPEDDYAWIERGAIETQLGRHGLALECFSKAMTINPDNRFAYKYKLMWSRQLKDYYGLVNCWICNSRFPKQGIEPIPYWDIPFDLCSKCYQEYLAATKTRHVTCTELLDHSSSTTEGVLLAFSLGDKGKFVFEPTDKKVLPIIIDQDVMRVQPVGKDAISGQFLPVPETSADTGTYIQLDYLIDGKMHSLIFSLNKELRLMLDFMKDVAAKLKRKSV